MLIVGIAYMAWLCKVFIYDFDFAKPCRASRYYEVLSNAFLYIKQSKFYLVP